MRRFYMFYSLRYYKIQIVWTGRQSIGLLIAEKVIFSRLLAVQIVVDLRFLQLSIYKILNVSLRSSDSQCPKWFKYKHIMILYNFVVCYLKI